jgi:hypothetical protein
MKASGDAFHCAEITFMVGRAAPDLVPVLEQVVV